MVEERASECVPASISGTAPVVLAIGRLVPQKNFGILLEAFAIARRSLDLRLLLVGSGPLRSDVIKSADASASGTHFASSTR